MLGWERVGEGAEMGEDAEMADGAEIGIRGQ